MGMQSHPKSIQGLYAITPDGLPTEELLKKCEHILIGGARVLQYRNKNADAQLKQLQAQALRQLTHRYATLFIVNDDPRLGTLCDADGIHLGKDDGSISDARKIFPKGCIGVSCYDSLERAEQAAKEGADHIAFGAMFSSMTKPGACLAPLSLLKQAKKIGLPIVAIGGITLSNAPQILDAGADALAVITALFDDPQPTLAAQKFSDLFERK